MKKDKPLTAVDITRQRLNAMKMDEEREKKRLEDEGIIDEEKRKKEEKRIERENECAHWIMECGAFRKERLEERRRFNINSLPNVTPISLADALRSKDDSILFYLTRKEFNSLCEKDGSGCEYVDDEIAKMMNKNIHDRAKQYEVDCSYRMTCMANEFATEHITSCPSEDGHGRTCPFFIHADTEIR